MAKTIEQIQEEVQQIKNETVAKQNTATRVGGALEDMVEKMEADSISVEGKLSNLGSKVGELDNQISTLTGHNKYDRDFNVPYGYTSVFSQLQLHEGRTYTIRIRLDNAALKATYYYISKTEGAGDNLFSVTIPAGETEAEKTYKATSTEKVYVNVYNTNQDLLSGNIYIEDDYEGRLPEEIEKVISEMPTATSSQSGLMSADDKAVLEEVSGKVNGNLYRFPIKVGDYIDINDTKTNIPTDENETFSLMVKGAISSYDLHSFDIEGNRTPLGSRLSPNTWYTYSKNDTKQIALYGGNTVVTQTGYAEIVFKSSIDVNIEESTVKANELAIYFNLGQKQVAVEVDKEGYYINTAGRVTAYAPYVISKPFSVHIGDIITLTNMRCNTGIATLAYAYADGTYKLIAEGTGQTKDAVITATIQENENVVVCYHTSYTTNGRVDVTTSALIESIFNSIPKGGEDGENNPLFGKKLYFAGDSIGAGQTEDGVLYNWAKIIGDKNKMRVKNVSRGGSTIRFKAETTGCVRKMIESVDADSDYIIFQGGVNDGIDDLGIFEKPIDNFFDTDDYDETKSYVVGDIVRNGAYLARCKANTPIPAGTYNKACWDGHQIQKQYPKLSTLDLNLTYPSMEYICKYLMINYPDKKFGFIVTYRGDMLDSWNAMSDNLIAICEKYGMPYIDLRKDAGFNIQDPELMMVYSKNETLPTYDSTKGYAVDEQVIYNGVKYKASVVIASPAGDFDEKKWTYVGAMDGWHCNSKGYLQSASKIEAWMKTL